MSEQMREPAWLTHMADQRLAQMKESLGGGLPTEYGVALTPLTEPPEGATEAQAERWDRTCDKCGRFCGPNSPFYTGGVVRMIGTTPVHITFGICEDCKP